MFHRVFFSVQSLSISLSFYFLLFPICENGKIYQKKNSFFFVLYMNARFVLLAEIKGSICISKYKSILWETFSRPDSSFRIYHLIVLCRMTKKWRTITFSYKNMSFIFITRETETDTGKRAQTGGRLLCWLFLYSRCDSVFKALRLRYLNESFLSRRPLSPSPHWALAGRSPKLLNAIRTDWLTVNLCDCNSPQTMGTCVYIIS